MICNPQPGRGYAIASAQVELMNEKSPSRKSTNPRPRNTITIIKAAKEAGAASVTFPDGTVITMARDDGPKTVLSPASKDATAS
jgi:hypothetical protein